LRVSKYDILSEQIEESKLRLKSQDLTQSLSNFKALPHPSNNSVFLVNGSKIFLYDSINDVILEKPFCHESRSIIKQAICYNEGFIYLIGGFDLDSKESVKTVFRYNIVTEKWQQLSSMLFDKMDCGACAINEY